MKRRGIPVTLLVLALARAAPASAQEADSTAPVVVDGDTLFMVRGVSAFPAERRAVEIAGRIRDFAADRSLPVDSLRIEDTPLGTRVTASGRTLFAVMDAHVVAHHMDQRNSRRDRAVEVFQKRDELFLPLAPVTLPIDLARTRVEGGKQVQSTVAPVFMFDAVGHVAWLRRQVVWIQRTQHTQHDGARRLCVLKEQHDFAAYVSAVQIHTGACGHRSRSRLPLKRHQRRTSVVIKPHEQSGHRAVQGRGLLRVHGSVDDLVQYSCIHGLSPFPGSIRRNVSSAGSCRPSG